MVRSLSRKVAAEVKKADANKLLNSSDFFTTLRDNASSGIFTLADIAYLYPVFSTGDV